MLLTNRLPLRVTGRRTTPGVRGKDAASSPLSFPEEMCRSFANSERLSRLDSALRKAASRALPLGGDAGPGLAIELCPLAELELFRLLPLRSLARCMLIKFGTPLAPGENRFAAQPVLLPGIDPGKAMLLFACGVPIMGSSLSSGSSGSTSSDELLDSSEPIMLMLPTELEGAVLSPFPHPLCMFTFGEFMSIEFDRGLRDGMLMPFCVIVGDESGDDCSGSVEWCRCVQALENSAPRDRRGNSEAGDAYVFRASN